MLDAYYDNAVRTNVNGTDDNLKKGMTDVILALKLKPQPVVSFIAAEEDPPAGQQLATSSRENKVQRDLAETASIRVEVIPTYAEAKELYCKINDDHDQAILEYNYAQALTVQNIKSGSNNYAEAIATYKTALERANKVKDAAVALLLEALPSSRSSRPARVWLCWEPHLQGQLNRYARCEILPCHRR